jgi:hypothetical protein
LAPATWLIGATARAGAVGNLETRQHGAGETCEFAVAAQRPLGFTGRSAGVTECSDVVGSGEIPRRDAADDLHGGDEIDAIFGAAECENAEDPSGPRRQLAAALQKRIGVDDEDLGFAILDLMQLVLQRSERMQPSGRHSRNLGRDADAPGIRSICAQQRHARGRTPASVHQDRLHATDPFDRATIGDRSSQPTERSSRRVAP